MTQKRFIAILIVMMAAIVPTWAQKQVSAKLTEATVYLRGASVLPKLPEGTTALKAEKPRDEYLEATDWKYPLVKIFNNIWMREAWHSGWTKDNPIDEVDITINGEAFKIKCQYFLRYDANYTLQPAGWRLPTKDDCQDIIDKLVNNGFSQPLTAMLYGGVTGFEEMLSYRWVDFADSPVAVSHYRLDPTGTFDFDRYYGRLEIGATAGSLSIRFVKK